MEKGAGVESRTSIAALAGDKCPTLGHVVVQPVGEHIAFAMSRGRFPKGKGAVDPNEDAVLVAEGPTGVFAAVLDGHLGFDAARAALQACYDHATDIVEQPLYDPRVALNAVIADARVNIADALATTSEERRASRTAMTLALVARGRVWVATIGDTYAYLHRRGRRRSVRFRQDIRFLGPEPVRASVDRKRVGAGDRLLLASDGLTDFTRPGWAPDVLAGAPPEVDAAAIAARLLDGALAGGAGDNVTVVCVKIR